MPYINIFNVPHFYVSTPRISNSETTLVFVHGWLLSQSYWQPVITSLKEEFQCIGYDLRGFGSSNRDVNQRSLATDSTSSTIHPYGLTAYAQDLGALLEALTLDSVWLIGHSLGGSIALWTAKLFPQHVKGVICINAGGGVYLPKEFQRFRQAGQQIVRWRPRWLSNIPFIDHAFAQLMVFRPLAQHWGHQRVQDLLAADERAATGVLLESTTQSEVHRLPQVVADLRQPVHFIAGSNDTVMEEKYVRHLASFHPFFKYLRGNVTVLPNCGHMAMVEQPGMITSSIRSLIQQYSTPLAA